MKSISALLAALFICTLSTVVYADSDRIKNIYEWAKKEMLTDKDFQAPLPPVIVIFKGKLKGIVLENHGGAREDIIKRLPRIGGVYYPGKRVIYVADLVNDCMESAIISHELAHYIQHMKRGNKLYKLTTEKEREAVATSIQSIYYNTFCMERSMP